MEVGSGSLKIWASSRAGINFRLSWKFYYYICVYYSLLLSAVFTTLHYLNFILILYSNLTNWSSEWFILLTSHLPCYFIVFLIFCLVKFGKEGRATTLHNCCCFNNCSVIILLGGNKRIWLPKKAEKKSGHWQQINLYDNLFNSGASLNMTQHPLVSANLPPSVNREGEIIRTQCHVS